MTIPLLARSTVKRLRPDGDGASLESVPRNEKRGIVQRLKQRAERREVGAAPMKKSG
jgi:hypothetical protein